MLSIGRKLKAGTDTGFPLRHSNKGSGCGYNTADISTIVPNVHPEIVRPKNVKSAPLKVIQPSKWMGQEGKESQSPSSTTAQKNKAIAPSYSSHPLVSSKTDSVPKNTGHLFTISNSFQSWMFVSGHVHLRSLIFLDDDFAVCTITLDRRVSTPEIQQALDSAQDPYLKLVSTLN